MNFNNCSVNININPVGTHRSEQVQQNILGELSLDDIAAFIKDCDNWCDCSYTSNSLLNAINVPSYFISYQHIQIKNITCLHSVHCMSPCKL